MLPLAQLAWKGELTPGSILTSITIVLSVVLAIRTSLKEQRERESKRVEADTQREIQRARFEAEHSSKIETLAKSTESLGAAVLSLAEKVEMSLRMQPTIQDHQHRIEKIEDSLRGHPKMT